MTAFPLWILCGLRQALRVDLATVVDVWVEAFVHDPCFPWIAVTEIGT